MFLPCKNRSYYRALYPENRTVAKVKEGSKTLNSLFLRKKSLSFKSAWPPTPYLQYRSVVFQSNSWKIFFFWQKVSNKHDCRLGQGDSQSVRLDFPHIQWDKVKEGPITKVTGFSSLLTVSIDRQKMFFSHTSSKCCFVTHRC